LLIDYPDIGEVRFVLNSRSKYVRILVKPFGKVRVTVPKRADIHAAIAFVETKKKWILRVKSRIDAQEFLSEKDIELLRKEAKEYLPQRTEQLANEHGFSYISVTVKNLSSRWGSCSAKNRINLNIHLMRLPQNLLDYVILHELTHTIHKNHGKDFWQALDNLTDGKAKQLKDEIKKYSNFLFQ